jgi:hypothetical protein
VLIGKVEGGKVRTRLRLAGSRTANANGW